MDITLTSARTGSGPCVSFPSDTCGAASRNSLRTILILSLQESEQLLKFCGGGPERSGQEDHPRGEGRGGESDRREGEGRRWERGTQREGGRAVGLGVLAIAQGHKWQPSLWSTWEVPGLVAPILGQGTRASMWPRGSGAQDFIHSLRQRARQPWLAKTEGQGGGLSDFFAFPKIPVLFAGPWGLERGLEATEL